MQRSYSYEWHATRIYDKYRISFTENRHGLANRRCARESFDADNRSFIRVPLHSTLFFPRRSRFLIRHYDFKAIARVRAHLYARERDPLLLHAINTYFDRRDKRERRWTLHRTFRVYIVVFRGRLYAWEIADSRRIIERTALDASVP